MSAAVDTLSPSQEQDLRLAGDSATPGSALEALAGPLLSLHAPFSVLYSRGSGEQNTYPAALWRTLAANPNTPLRLLARLAAHLPDEFLTNPAAPLVVLEEPRFAHWLEEEIGDLGVAGHIVSDLLRRPNVPSSLVAALSTGAKEKSLREEASLHIALANAGDMGAWRERARHILRSHARALRGVNRQLLLDLVEAEVAPRWITDDAALEEPLPEPDLSGKWGKPLANAAAADPDTPAAKLLTLSDRRNRSIDRALAENPATPTEALHRILENWQEETPGYIIAQRPELPVSIAAKLIASNGPVTRRMMRRRGYGTDEDSFSTNLRREATRGLLFGGTAVAPILCCLTYIGLPPEYGRESEGTAEYLEANAQGRLWLVRLGVALCPLLTDLLPGAEEMLTRLSEEGNTLIRAAARARLAGEVGI